MAEVNKAVNCDMAVSEDNILTITVDLNQNSGLSKSGKSTIVASTKGGKPVPNAPDTHINLNIYSY